MWYNSIMKWLLGSPLHGFISKSMMLISYNGRKSGKVYTIPVNYVRQDELLSVVSHRNRIWWRNLRGGAPVTLLIQGAEQRGTATVSEDDHRVAEKLTTFLRQVPHYAKYFKVTLDANGEPNQALTQQASVSRVIVEIQLITRARP